MSSKKRNSRPSAPSAAFAGRVEMKTGEAVVGPLADMFPVQGPDINSAWLYFSVPQSTFDAFGAAAKSGEIELTAGYGTGTVLGSVLVRIRTRGHTVFVQMNESQCASALEEFERSGIVRVTVYSQAKTSQPVVFARRWPQLARIDEFVGLPLEYSHLLADSRAMKAPAYVTICAAETPEEWKKRTSKPKT